MTRLPGLALLLALLMMVTAQAEKQPDQRRLLRIESRVYGWYGVAEPSFDKTIGRRELFKINAGEQFLAGLDGRLVILQGRFSEGQLDLGELAPPPISVPESARRHRFTLQAPAGAGLWTTGDGYRLRTSETGLAAGMVVDVVVTPGGGQDLEVVGVLEAAPSSAGQDGPPPAPIPAGAASLQGGALLELEMTQAFLDSLVDLGREQAGMKAGFQGLTLEVSQLRILLPDGASSAQDPWSLEGTVEFGYVGTGSLAESSFVISARPLVEGNVLKLEPNWQEIKLEGQLPFGFVLDSSLLGQLTTFLPQQLPVVNLDWITSYLRGQGLVGADEQVDWFLGGGGAGTLRLGLGPAGSTLGSAGRALTPGNFRLQLAAPVADRLVRRGVQLYLNPDKPFVPNPPITVGKVLFVSIKVEQVFLRSLESGYSNGVFRFRDLVVDVAWRAGPLSGLEPLLSASGYIAPRLSAPGPDGVRYWEWTIKIEKLAIRSERIPGDKEQLAAELIPRLEKELGTEMAQKQKIPSRLDLAGLLPSSTNAVLEVTELRALDAYLEMEGRLLR